MPWRDWATSIWGYGRGGGGVRPWWASIWGHGRGGGGAFFFESEGTGLGRAGAGQSSGEKTIGVCCLDKTMGWECV
jgi:hypothetical protein